VTADTTADSFDPADANAVPRPEGTVMTASPQPPGRENRPAPQEADAPAPPLPLRRFLKRLPSLPLAAAV
jgi:hypothetical protein